MAAVPTRLLGASGACGSQAATVPARLRVAPASPRPPVAGTGAGVDTTSIAATGTAALGVVEVPTLPLAGEATRPAGHATGPLRVVLAKTPRLAPTDARPLPDEAP